MVFKFYNKYIMLFFTCFNRFNKIYFWYNDLIINFVKK